nr:MAG TPA: hypothetical protein [Caudoviricetes sp.]DAV09313.1 MAG TPA: hypothetical protein [Caudoviricetes sp.]
MWYSVVSFPQIHAQSVNNFSTSRRARTCIRPRT